MENLVNASHLLSFYTGKKVLVTGHTGFKGAWLVAALHLLKAKTKGYALDPEIAGGLFDFLKPLELLDNVINDIRDIRALRTEIEDFQPDIVFHLAAQPLVRRSYQIPAETFEINVAGTANLLEVVSGLKNKCAIVLITTDKVYHNREEDILYREDDMLGGYDPYSASKACCEIVADSFRRSFFNANEYDLHQKSLATVRAGNVIGGGDWSLDRLVPDIVHSLVTNKTIMVRNPGSVRPWQHVLEAIAGYLQLGMQLYRFPLEHSKAYNLGPAPEDHLTVKDLVQKAVSIWGSGDWKDVSDPRQPHEASLLKLDISRAMNELKWSPKLNADQAIEWTIDWYKTPAALKAEYSFRQIKDYFSL